VPLNRAVYIDNSHVKGFVSYLSRVISGATPLDFAVGFSRNQLYDGFELIFPGDIDSRDGGGPVYVVFARTLKDLFRMYWWDRKNYDDNKQALDGVSAAIEAAIQGENSENHRELADTACHGVMKWGFGEGRRPYKANMSWAKGLEKKLADVLRIGRESLRAENPSIDAFGVNSDSQSETPKMNAGWTKYYALALPDHVIYDGRVGAALGFLARRYLESLPRHERLTSVPGELGFLWANGDGENKLRNPSAGEYQFGKLYGGHFGSKSWARVNVLANWVLCEARDQARADWCSGQDGLRRLEAALFMLGYDFSRVCAADNTCGTNEFPNRKRRTSDIRPKAVVSSVRPANSPLFGVTSQPGGSSPVAEKERKRLPEVTAPNFRAALKEARLAAGLSYSELARRADIHAVMPSRYENAEHSNATLPGMETWEKLNAVLFPNGGRRWGRAS
jgi:ribosome-binding protein aMBF1 (putative translation factor)